MTSIGHDGAADRGPTARERTLIARAFAAELSGKDIHELLAYLGDVTEYRFTGVYRFAPGWVVSVALWDRENPALQIGADVKMKESYCWLTGLGDDLYVIEDAMADGRLAGHAAQTEVRAYIAVLLRDERGTPWGTLCHFDFKPRTAPPGVLDRLKTFRPLVEEMLVHGNLAEWEPDAPSLPRGRAAAPPDISPRL